MTDEEYLARLGLLRPQSGKRKPEEPIPAGSSVLDVPIGGTRRIPDTVLRRQYEGPNVGEATPYDPTLRERLAAKTQDVFESLGADRYKARQRAETILGGPSSNLPLHIGLADFAPFLGTTIQTEEAGRGLEQAGRDIQRGDYLSAGIEGLGAGLGLLPGLSATAKGAKVVGKRVREAADPEAIRQYVRQTQGLTGLPGTAVIKPKGGNWLSGSVEKATEPLKRGVVDEAALRRLIGDEFTNESLADPINNATNNWINTKLNKYIKNEMGTADDPIRKQVDEWAQAKGELLAQKDEQIDRLQKKMVEARQARGLTPDQEAMLTRSRAELEELRRQRKYIEDQKGLHFDPYTVTNGEELTLDTIPGVVSQRTAYGFPREGLGKDPTARQWEALSDMAISDIRAGTIQNAPNTAAQLAKAEQNYQQVVDSVNDAVRARIRERSPDISERDLNIFAKDFNVQKSLRTKEETRLLEDARAELFKAQNADKPKYKTILEENPWVMGLDPEARLFERPITDELGFDHLVDELKNAMRPDSGLPSRLQLKPEDLSKMTVAKAARLVDEINAYRSGVKADADRAVASNAATVEVKSYDVIPGTDVPNTQGFAWKQIKPVAMPEAFVPPDRYAIVRPTPSAETLAIRDNETGKYITTGLESEEKAKRHLFETLNKKQVEEALKYEGDILSHCVGGYCDDVLSGRSQIFSLRDDRGVPHVTIEVEPGPRLGFRSGEGPKDAQEDYVLRTKYADDLEREAIKGNVTFAEWWRAKNNIPEPPREMQITQIKGKSNNAPKKEYLPFVQDFVRSGNWDKVGDLKNTNLIKFGNQYVTKEEIAPMISEARKFIDETPALEAHRRAQKAYEDFRGEVPSAEYTRLQREAGQPVHPTIPYTYREMKSIFNDPGAYDEWSLGANLENVNKLRRLFGEQGYASGGIVEDPNKAAFGIYPSSGKRPERLNVSRDVNAPLQMARGWAAGLLGLPGDIEGLGRMLANFSFGQGGVNVNETPALPTSDFYREVLPGHDPRAAAQAISGGAALTGGLGATKAVGRLAEVAKPENIRQYIRQTQGLTGLPGTAVIKPKGGNWLEGNIEKSTEPLKRQGVAVMPLNETELADFTRQGYTEFNPSSGTYSKPDPVNTWIDKKLNKYIRNEMGTPEDPVRKLAEKGQLHFEAPYVEQTAKVDENRRLFAQENNNKWGYGQSQLAQNWEDASDRMLNVISAESIQSMNPATFNRNWPGMEWIQKLNPETPIYGLNRGVTGAAGRDPSIESLGFPHLIDELRNAVAPNSDLPAHLRWKPEDLDKVTMAQAVERVSKINDWRAAQMEAAKKAAREGIPIHKQYEGGYQWMAAPDTAKDPKSLKYIQDVGCESGWCTQGENIAKQYGGGGNQLYVLHDPDGKSVVQISVRPAKARSEPQEMQAIYDKVQAEANAKNFNTQDEWDRFYFPRVEELQMQMLAEKSKNLPPEIVEIKGRQNRAPKDEYLPMVQDFVRSGKWSRVGDLQNTGLYSASDVVTFMPESFEMSRNARQLAIGRAKQAGELPNYMTKNEYEQILKKFAPEDTWLKGEKGMAAGGLVQNTDTLRDKLIAAGMDPEQAMQQALRMADQVEMQAGGLAKVIKSVANKSQAAKTTQKTAGEAKNTLIPTFGGSYDDDVLRRTRNNFNTTFGMDVGQGLTKDYEFVDINRLKLNEPVNEARVTKLMGAMKKDIPSNSKIPPIVIDSTGGVLDGHHRVEAARRLGANVVPALEKFERAQGPQIIKPEPTVQVPYAEWLKEQQKFQVGGLAKAAKAALQKKHPTTFPPIAPLTKQEIRPMAQRISEQMTDQFVRPDPKMSVNPAGKSRKIFEREKNLPVEVTQKIPARPATPVNYEKLEGGFLVGVPGDPTIGGVAKEGALSQIHEGATELKRLGDVEFQHPVQLFGGPQYGAFAPDEHFWASNLGPAKTIQNTVAELGQDAPVYGQYIKMSPESSNFALHNLDALLSYIQPEKLSKSKLETLNREIRKGSPKYGQFPDFKGFEDPVDVLLQSQLNSDLRKHIAETLMKPTVTEKLKLRPGSDVLFGITEPSLRNVETGLSGFSIGEMRPKAQLTESRHPTYTHDIPGVYIGQSKYPIPVELAFPTSTAYARSQLKPGVQEFNLLKMIGPRERIDPQYIDQMKMYEELMKQYTGKKEGGAVEAANAADTSNELI